MMKKIQAIIALGGTGTRLKASVPKPFMELNGKPLCVYALDIFEQSPIINSIIVVGHPDKLLDYNDLIRRYHFQKITRVVAGGDTRRESVAHGLAVLDEDTDIVVVHDGARPFVTSEIIRDAVALCGGVPAVVAAVPVKSTIKRVDQDTLNVYETVDRANLWEIQTPQVFTKEVLLKAHAQSWSDESTDDAMMVERLGIPVKVLKGSDRNIKITTLEDLTIAEAFLQSRKL